MDLKNVAVLFGIISSSVFGIIWVYKNWAKPVIQFFKGIDEIKENQKKITENTKRIDFINKKVDSLIMLDDTPLFVCNELGLCILANDSLCKLFGSKENEMMGFGWVGFVAPEERENVVENWNYHVNNGSNEIVSEYTIIHGLTGERVKLKYHAILSRDLGKILVSVGKVKNK